MSPSWCGRGALGKAADGVLPFPPPPCLALQPYKASFSPRPCSLPPRRIARPAFKGRLAPSERPRLAPHLRSKTWEISSTSLIFLLNAKTHGGMLKRASRAAEGTRPPPPARSEGLGASCCSLSRFLPAASWLHRTSWLTLWRTRASNRRSTRTCGTRSSTFRERKAGKRYRTRTPARAHTRTHAHTLRQSVPFDLHCERPPRHLRAWPPVLCKAARR